MNLARSCQPLDYLGIFLQGTQGTEMKKKRNRVLDTDNSMVIIRGTGGGGEVGEGKGRRKREKKGPEQVL